MGKIKTYQKDMTIEEAVDKAVKECIQEGILKDILISHQAEVKDMLLTEYNKKKTLQYLRREYEEDVAQARRETVRAREEAVNAKKDADNARKDAAEFKKQTQKELAQKDKLIRSLQEKLAASAKK